MKKIEKKSLLLFAIVMIPSSLNFSTVLTGNTMRDILAKIPIFQIAGFFFFISSVNID